MIYEKRKRRRIKCIQLHINSATKLRRHNEEKVPLSVTFASFYKRENKARARTHADKFIFNRLFSLGISMKMLHPTSRSYLHKNIIRRILLRFYRNCFDQISRINIWKIYNGDNRLLLTAHNPNNVRFMIHFFFRIFSFFIISTLIVARKGGIYDHIRRIAQHFLDSLDV